MRPTDAEPLLRQVLQDWGLTTPAGAFTEEWCAERGLLGHVHWARHATRGDGGGAWTDLRWLAFEFRDGFPDPDSIPTRHCRDDEPPIECAIRRANRGVFVNGNLPESWTRLIIPEPTVDLFEAATVVVVESLRLRVSFIDTWYYHLRLGEIHCATKALRSPQRMARTPWWDALPSHAIEVEPEPI